MADLRTKAMDQVVNNKDNERKVAQLQDRNQRLRQELADTEHEIQKMTAECRDLEVKKVTNDNDLRDIREQQSRVEATCAHWTDSIRQLERDNFQRRELLT